MKNVLICGFSELMVKERFGSSNLGRENDFIKTQDSLEIIPHTPQFEAMSVRWCHTWKKGLYESK